MSVEVIVPWRAGCSHREAAWEYVRGRLEATFDDAPITVAELAEGPWVKALAVNPAVARSEADVIVVHDADVWCDGLAEAVAMVATEQAGWAVPHWYVRRLSEAATRQVYAGHADPDVFYWQNGLLEHPYPGTIGGGIIVARREILLDVPFDPRFVGWGGEDHAVGEALTTLHGDPWRTMSSRLSHFWHPPQRRLNRQVGSKSSQELRRRYRGAYLNHKAMRAIVDEIGDQ